MLYNPNQCCGNTRSAYLYPMRICVAIIIALGCLMPGHAQPVLDLSPNIHTVTVNLFLPEDDPEGDAYGVLDFINAPATLWAPGFPLSRVQGHPRLLSGMVMHGRPGAKVDIHLAVFDPTTPANNDLHFFEYTHYRLLPDTGRYSQTLYVHPGGSGSNFTLQAPGSLADAIQIVQPGTRIMLLAGTYYTGGISWTANGTEQDPIQIAGIHPDSVIISGAQATAPVWTATSTPGLYFINSAAVNPNGVFADGIRLYPHRTLPDLQEQKITVGVDLNGPIRWNTGLEGFFRNPSTNPLLNSDWQNPNRLWVRFSDTSNPSGKDIRISRYRNAFVMNGAENVTFSNLTFEYYGVSPSAAAMRLIDCENIHFTGCRFQYNDISILLEGTTSGTTIHESIFRDAMDGWMAWVIKSTYDDFFPYSDIYPFYSRMLERGALIFGHGYAGRNTNIIGNRFSHYAQAGHLSPPSVNAAFQATYDIDFFGNIVEHCTEDGFEIDGDARGIRVMNNHFRSINAPLSLATAEGGPVFILKNTFHTITADTFMINPVNGKVVQRGHPLKFQTGNTSATMGPVFFFHNTVFTNSNALSLDLVAPPRWANLDIRNNIFWSDAADGAEIYYPAGKIPLTLDFNAWYSPNGLTVTVDTNTNDGHAPVMLSSLNDFRSYTGWEAQGIWADPMLDTAQPFGLHMALMPGSPCIDAGDLIPGINNLYFQGIAPDMGASEVLNTAVAMPPANPLWHIFPNPSNGTVYWQLPSHQDGARLHIYDWNGRVVAAFDEYAIPASFTFPSSAPGGMYFFRLSTGRDILTGKVVLVK